MASVSNYMGILVVSGAVIAVNNSVPNWDTVEQQVVAGEVQQGVSSCCTLISSVTIFEKDKVLRPPFQVEIAKV